MLKLITALKNFLYRAIHYPNHKVDFQALKLIKTWFGLYPIKVLLAVHQVIEKVITDCSAASQINTFKLKANT